MTCATEPIVTVEQDGAEFYVRCTDCKRTVGFKDSREDAELLAAAHLAGRWHAGKAGR